MEGKEVSIAGRMMSKRVMGKASFCDVLDRYDSIQVYVARDQIGEDSYKDFKKYDIGDIIGVKGTVFRTKMGRSRSTLIRSRCSPRTWFRCRRSSTAFRIPISGTASGIWTSS